MVSCRPGSAGRRSAATRRACGARPAEGGNKAAKHETILRGTRTAKRVWLEPYRHDDREGQLIGQEILEHYEYGGQIIGCWFTAQDAQTIRDAFDRAKPNSEYARLYAAAVCTPAGPAKWITCHSPAASVSLGHGARRVIGVRRVKTPTFSHRLHARVGNPELRANRLFRSCRDREDLLAANSRCGTRRRTIGFGARLREKLPMRLRASSRRLLCASRISAKDRPSYTICHRCEALCSSRFGWPASKPLAVAQELYDGQGKKIITYPRAEVRYLPQSLISDVPRIAAGLRVGQSFNNQSPYPRPPMIRKGARERLFLRQGAGGLRIAITPLFQTSTRSTNCRRYGLACRPTMENCSTSSRGPIWPP